MGVTIAVTIPAVTVPATTSSTSGTTTISATVGTTTSTTQPAIVYVPRHRCPAPPLVKNGQIADVGQTWTCSCGLKYRSRHDIVRTGFPQPVWGSAERTTGGTT